jgi:hypothetical protein
MKRINFLFLLFLTSCTQVKITKEDVDFAKCICMINKSELRAVQPASEAFKEGFYAVCISQTYYHEYSTYTEGCSKELK